MSISPFVQLHNLFYYIAGGEQPLLQNISMTFGAEKVGLVGRNGVGKSSLLKLITGILQPSQGSVSVQAKLGYLEQNHPDDLEKTVAQSIGVAEKINALQCIMQGSVDPNDYAILSDDWVIEDRAKDYLDRFGLRYLSLTQSVAR